MDFNEKAEPPDTENYSYNQHQLQLSLMNHFEAYDVLEKLILSPSDLQNNGFVFVDPSSGQARVDDKPKRPCWAEPFNPLRRCVRCGDVFKKNETFSACYFHKNGTNCCAEKYCASHPEHVHNITDKGELEKFLYLSPSWGLMDIRNNMVVALDAEMVYTENGMEPARVTLVDHFKNTIEDIYIKPIGRIIDFNTQFSGIRAEDMNFAVPLETAHQRMVQFINSNSILIGHNLSNDLKVLKLIHSKVVDTAVLFVKNGKYQSLKNLARMFLRKDIQGSDNGHDSAIDARTCIELIERRYQYLVHNIQM